MSLLEAKVLSANFSSIVMKLMLTLFWNIWIFATRA